jgi:hypothetical protein
MQQASYCDLRLNTSSLRECLDDLVLFLKDNTLPATIHRAHELYGSYDDFPELLTLLFAELLRVEEIEYPNGPCV